MCVSKGLRVREFAVACARQVFDEPVSRSFTFVLFSIFVRGRYGRLCYCCVALVAHFSGNQSPCAGHNLRNSGSPSSGPVCFDHAPLG